MPSGITRRAALRLAGGVAGASAAAALLASCGAGSGAYSDGARSASESEPTNDGSAVSSSTSSSASGSSSTSTSSQPSSEEALDQQAEEALASLTLEQKACQLLFVTPEALTGVGQVVAAGDATREALARRPVGGLCYFGQNIQDPEQVAGMLANANRYEQEAVGLPLLMSVDEEGGTVSRVGGRDGFDVANVGDMRDVGATGDTGRAHDVCAGIAGYLVPLGFNLDFAPVADVSSGPGDVMDRRSFGTSAEAVAPMVGAAVRGFLDGGIACCAKHFPGLGGASGDSETEPISTSRTLDELRAESLPPFRSAVEAGVPMVMVGHLSCPAVTGDDTPASLSGTAVNGLIRDELGFDGVIITDSLSMGAVTGLGASGELCVRALAAGVDMLLMPQDLEGALSGVLGAVEAGTLTEERIDESVRRIVRMKLSLAA